MSGSKPDSEGFARSLRERYSIELWVTPPKWGDSYEPNIVKIDSIYVPEERRNEGVGSKVMQELCDWADQHNIILSLTASGDFGGSVTKLKRFYPRFGFVPNKGRNKDFRTRDTLIRYPRPR